ncbi:MAG: hypothetical protein NZ899_04005 [Thermoguttaceae bacterium]|nr:hypothetical protein [Thermoguttaceae bacterium]MDW8077702.1 hypothetical protein [Thermoguttaceae bacterium]
MARIFALTLGPLGSAASVAAGMLEGAPEESVLLCAWLHLIALAAVGYVVGVLAEEICRLPG